MFYILDKNHFNINQKMLNYELSLKLKNEESIFISK